MSKHLREFSASERKVGQAHAKAFTEFFKGRRGATPDSGSLEAEAEVAAAQAASESALLSLPNVVGVGPAYKIKGGKPVNTFALTVFVEKKLEKGALSKGEVVPPEIDGVVTDVVEDELLAGRAADVRQLLLARERMHDEADAVFLGFPAPGVVRRDDGDALGRDATDVTQDQGQDALADAAETDEHEAPGEVRVNLVRSHSAG